MYINWPFDGHEAQKIKQMILNEIDLCYGIYVCLFDYIRIKCIYRIGFMVNAGCESWRRNLNFFLSLRILWNYVIVIDGIVSAQITCYLFIFCCICYIIVHNMSLIHKWFLIEVKKCFAILFFPGLRKPLGH